MRNLKKAKIPIQRCRGFARVLTALFLASPAVLGSQHSRATTFVQSVSYTCVTYVGVVCRRRWQFCVLHNEPPVQGGRKGDAAWLTRKDASGWVGVSGASSLYVWQSSKHVHNWVTRDTALSCCMCRPDDYYAEMLKTDGTPSCCVPMLVLLVANCACTAQFMFATRRYTTRFDFGIGELMCVHFSMAPVPTL